MGDAAEAALDYWMNRHGLFGKPPRKRSFQKGSGRGKWRTAEGQVLDMKDMSDRHIENALRLCESRGNTGKADDFREELVRRSYARHSE